MKTNYWIKKYKYKYFQKQLYRLNGCVKKNFISNKIFSFTLKTLNSKFLFSAQIEAGRRLIRHFIKKFIKIEINLLCDKSISLKSSGVRMGKGKGNLEEWVNCAKAGLLIYSLVNINYFQAKFLLLKSKRKFNFKMFFSQTLFLKHTVENKNLFY
jgi:large subunit ribosomal protein L16